MGTGSRENRSMIEVTQHMNDLITTNTDTDGTAIDISTFDVGKTFSFQIVDFNAGTFTPIIQESVDSAFTVPIDVPAANLIGTLAGATLTGLTAADSVLPTIGVIGTTERFFEGQDCIYGCKW